MIFRIKKDGRIGRQMGQPDRNNWICLDIPDELLDGWSHPDDLELHSGQSSR